MKSSNKTRLNHLKIVLVSCKEMSGSPRKGEPVVEGHRFPVLPVAVSCLLQENGLSSLST